MLDSYVNALLAFIIGSAAGFWVGLLCGVVATWAWSKAFKSTVTLFFGPTSECMHMSDTCAGGAAYQLDRGIAEHANASKFLVWCKKCAKKYKL